MMRMGDALHAVFKPVTQAKQRYHDTVRQTGLVHVWQATASDSSLFDNAATTRIPQFTHADT